ncbi:hypothetical protein [Halorarius litoreus]|uniref:hypothetical protein n=1 Tax=Halorarius litoreus TaxID=2962676 RepID=UPI0020CDB0F1|nr:hypothetical protein [Halorarius litoreus]
MDGEGAECSRCGATFDTQDELIVHSMDTHAGVDSGAATDEGDAANGNGDLLRGGGSAQRSERPRGDPAPDEIDDEAVERLLAAVEQQAAATGTLRIQYRQRFLAAAGLGVLGLAVAVSYLHFTGVVDTAVYTFALGTLFGLTLTYLQAFVQAVRG